MVMIGEWWVIFDPQWANISGRSMVQILYGGLFLGGLDTFWGAHILAFGFKQMYV